MIATMTDDELMDLWIECLALAKSSHFKAPKHFNAGIPENFQTVRALRLFVAKTEESL